MKFVNKALKFSKKAHKGVKRKWSTEDYFSHPLGVMNNVSKYWHISDPYYSYMLAAALLHDTVEDTDVKIEEIQNEFGDIVGNLVKQLSNDPDVKNLIGKKEYNAQHILEMDERALMIKLCDRLDNISDWNKSPVEFKEYYFVATKYLIDNLKKNRKLNRFHINVVNEIENILQDIEKYLKGERNE